MAALDNLYDQESTFWKEYVEARPKVPDSFFNRILGYHAEHGGHFGTLHDTGAGPGVHFTRMSKKFQQVIVSDAAESNVSIARKHLEKIENCSFRVAKLEDTNSLEPASVDMVFAMNVLHFTDIDQAMKAVAHQLKPGGTFVGAATGILALRDPEIHKMWLEINRRLNEICLGLEQTRPIWTRVLSIANNNYETIPLDTKYFYPHPQRVRLGRSMDFRDFVPEALHSMIPWSNRVGEDDEIVIEDNDEWDIEIDVHGIRRVFDTYRFDMTRDEKLMDLWRQLQDEMGESKVPACWPSLLLLATRR